MLKYPIRHADMQDNLIEMDYRAAIHAKRGVRPLHLFLYPLNPPNANLVGGDEIREQCELADRIICSELENAKK